MLHSPAARAFQLVLKPKKFKEKNGAEGTQGFDTDVCKNDLRWQICKFIVLQIHKLKLLNEVCLNMHFFMQPNFKIMFHLWHWDPKCPWWPWCLYTFNSAKQLRNEDIWCQRLTILPRLLKQKIICIGRTNRWDINHWTVLSNKQFAEPAHTSAGSYVISR